MTPAGLPHSDTPGSMLACSSPRLFAACHVLHRRLVPRHPPYALSRLTHKFPSQESHNPKATEPQQVRFVISPTALSRLPARNAITNSVLAMPKRYHQKHQPRCFQRDQKQRFLRLKSKKTPSFHTHTRLALSFHYSLKRSLPSTLVVK